MTTITKKSELLFLYESVYSMPNGDPFTGEQRYDEETKKVLVSDVRVKRFIRDYLSNNDKNHIYVQKKEGSSLEEDNENEDSEKSTKSKKEASGSSARIDELIRIFKKEIEDAKKKLEKGTKFSEAQFVLKKCIDVRLFGGISTKKGDTPNITGPIQFALLNPSLNSVNLRTHQNTSVLVSKTTNSQGAMATSTIVPYSIIQIHGWINPKSAEHTGMSKEDVTEMEKALWNSINDSNTRSKSNQSSLLMLEIVYKESFGKVYGVDRLIKITPKDNKKEEQIRSIDDYDFDLSALLEIAKSDKIEEIKYYTELPLLKEKLVGNKFKAITL